MPEATDTAARRLSEPAVGLLYTTAAFLLWGLAPIFWKAIAHVPPGELVAHRVLWAGLLMVLVLSWQRRWTHLPGVLSRGRTMVALAGTTALIGFNWFTFIWAVNSGRVLQVSLGYFINPLISVVLGLIFLGERLRRWQAVSVALATAGVLILGWRVGQVPWVALILAFTFGFYALLRKTVAASPEEGLAVETWLLAPLVLVYLGRLESMGEGALGHVDFTTHVLLVATGAITAAPLIWFTHGAKRLPLSTVGLLQYLAPTGHFLLAVLVYREPFEAAHLVAFVCIWTALAIFSVDARAAWRR